MQRFNITTLHFVLLLSLISFTGCDPKDKVSADSAVITGSIANLRDTVVKFSYYQYAFLEDLATTQVDIGPNGEFRLKIDSKQPLKGWFSLGKTPITEKFSFTTVDGKDSIMESETFDFKMLYLYVNPGDSIHLTTDVNAIKASTTISGSMNDDHLFISQEEQLFNDYKHKYLNNWYDLSQRQPDDFKKAKDQSFEEKMAFLAAFEKSHNMSETLIDHYKSNAYAALIGSKINYPSSYASYNKLDSIELPTQYYDFMNEVELNGDLGENGAGYFYNLRSFLQKKYELTTGKKVEATEFYPWLKNNLAEKQYYQFLAYALKSDFTQQIYSAFDEGNPFPEMAAAVKAKYKHLEGMLEGSEAPNLSFETIDGTEVTLHSLKGKYTYIDLWATWCVPCIAEIPSLQKVEKAYHGKNIQFVSISIDDEKDYEKWRTFVKDEALTGIQLLAKEVAKDSIKATFNVNLIPRFILLDPEARVIDATAPRPSDPKLIALLDAYGV